MSLTLHYHPLSSCCWKTLIALYENGRPFEARLVNLGDAAERAAFVALWPTAKIPLLQDGERVLPETSIQIEYLDGPQRRLLPADAEAQLDVRLWDRVFDQYVMTPMQGFIAQQRRPAEQRDAAAQAASRATLAMAYGLIDSRLGGHAWAAGEHFTMADCAAAPSLFYASTIEPIPAGHARLAAYFERLMARPSVQRVIREARPFFAYYPLRDALPARFLAD
jgi:glutathione S-transferase